MKIRVSLVIIFLFTTFHTPLNFAEASMETVDSILLDLLQELYEPVDFNHGDHGAMYDCSRCHHHTTGGPAEEKRCLGCHENSEPLADVSCSSCHKVNKNPPTSQDIDVYHIDIPGLLGALHLQCLGCHRSEDGPTGCIDCHDFSSAGRTRFALEK